MGRSLSAKLIYGYDLGGGEDEWKIAEVGEYGDLAVDWFDEDSEDGFDEQAERRLLNASGFTETYEDGNADYFAREREAKTRLGVEFTWYGVNDYSEHVLAAHKIDVCGAEVVDLAALAAHPDRGTWDTALSSALDALGITPTQERPGWILCSYYG